MSTPTKLPGAVGRPRGGSIDVVGRGDSWLGFMSRSGLTVLVDAKSKEDLLDAARALTPLR